MSCKRIMIRTGWGFFLVPPSPNNNNNNNNDDDDDDDDDDNNLTCSPQNCSILPTFKYWRSSLDIIS